MEEEMYYETVAAATPDMGPESRMAVDMLEVIKQDLGRRPEQKPEEVFAALAMTAASVCNVYSGQYGFTIDDWFRLFMAAAPRGFRRRVGMEAKL